MRSPDILISLRMTSDIATCLYYAGLDPFTGELRGTPRTAGLYEFTARVREYDAKSAGASRKLRIRVAG